jgi:hypothetical protein
MTMNLRTVFFSALLLSFMTTTLHAQVSSTPSTGTVNTVSSECTDGTDNDGDGTIDKTGRKVETKVYPPDTNCQPQGAMCEDGSTDCFSRSTAPVTCGSGLCLNIGIKNPLKVSTVQEALKLFMSAVIRIALPFIVLAFIWSGLSFVLARGNPENLKKAKTMFFYTIIGTLLILGAWTITNAIIGTVNSVTG